MDHSRQNELYRPPNPPRYQPKYDEVDQDQIIAFCVYVNGYRAVELRGEDAYREDDPQVDEGPSGGGLNNVRSDGYVAMFESVMGE